MTIAQFALLVTKFEGKKKEVNIAQVKEILRVINILVSGELYSIIRQARAVSADDSNQQMIPVTKKSKKA